MEINEAIIFLEKRGYGIVPPISKEIDPLFLKWWNLYNKKRNKEGCIKKWNKLTIKERIRCIEATPAYVASCTDGKIFQKDPLTYLNQKAWNDEIIYSNERRKERNLFNKAASIINSD